MAFRKPTRCADQPGEPVRGLELAGWRVALLPSCGYEVAFTPDRPMIGYAFEPQTGHHGFASSRVQAFRTRPNSLAHTPAGCEVYSTSSGGGEYLTLTPLVPANRPEHDARQFSDRASKSASRAALQLRRMLLSDCPDVLDFAVYVGDLCAAVETELSDSPTGEGREQGWMTPRRLALICERIEADLDQPLTVGQLAATLGLSERFFTRAFRAATGRTPHDYIIERRLYRARALLTAGDAGAVPGGRSLADVALACGFASQSHMTELFRRRLGLSPGRFRQLAGE